MNTKNTLRLRVVIASAILVALLLGGAAWSHLRDSHHHHSPSAVLQLDGGKRWPTDPALRHGFSEIRAAAVPVADAFARSQLTQPEASAFADAITANFTQIAQACKLPPAADATLHAIVVELMRGAALLANDPKSQEGMSLVRQTLRQYGEYFDHIGWTPLPEDPQPNPAHDAGVNSSEG